MRAKPISETPNACAAPPGDVDSVGQRDSCDPQWASDAHRLLEKHRHWLEKLVDRRMQPLDGGDEVLQEIWLAVQKSDAIPADEQQQVPWLARIAVRQAAMAWRTFARRRKRETAYADQVGRRINEQSNDPIYAMMAGERNAQVRDSLADLEPEFKEVLILKYVRGMKYQQIADHLNWNVKTVEYRLTQARKALRRRLIDADAEEAP